MGIYEKIGLFCLAIVVGFVYFKADARKSSTPPAASSSVKKTSSTPSITSSSAKKTSGVSPQRKGVGAARQAPILNQTGRMQYLQQNKQLTVGQILNILRTTNKNANFIVALDSNKNLVEGDPSGAIANSASVNYVNAQSKKLFSTTTAGATLDSIIQQNLDATVTLNPAPNVIQKMLGVGKLDTASKDAYSQILLYFTVDAPIGYNAIWFFIVDPWPPSIVVNKAYPVYDIIESW